MEVPVRYHHGSLRAALLDEAHRQLEASGYEAISLRALAAKIGVAASAPYNHFKARDDLLAALVADGATDLAVRYRAAAESTGKPLDRLERACVSYIQFAIDRPELFRLMFVAKIPWCSALKQQIEDSMVAYPVFETLVAATLPQADAIEVNARALSVWAAIHGMALLKFNGRLTRRYVPGQTDLSVIRAILGGNCSRVK